MGKVVNLRGQKVEPVADFLQLYRGLDQIEQRAVNLAIEIVSTSRKIVKRTREQEAAEAPPAASDTPD